MAVPEVSVKLNSLFHHLNHVFAGLESLRSQGRIKLSYHLPARVETDLTMQLVINGKNVFIDLGDDRNISEGTMETIANSDYAYKRMLKRSDLSAVSKLRPFGLNYAPYTHIWKFLPKALLSMQKDYVARAVTYHRFLSSLFPRKESVSTVRIESFESSMAEKQDLVIFCCRLWDPVDGEDIEAKQERTSINASRIELVAQLSKHFGKRFYGGIYRSSFSKDVPTHLLLPSEAAEKRNYLKMLRKSSVGIATPGIYNSIGWKFTEYVVSPMAIATNQIDEIALPGSFEEGQNYLTYEDIDGCLASVERLLSDKAFREAQMRNNLEYYQDYIHPDKVVMRILKEVLD